MVNGEEPGDHMHTRKSNRRNRSLELRQPAKKEIKHMLVLAHDIYHPFNPVYIPIAARSNQTAA